MQTYPTWPNLAAMLFDRARAWPDRSMLRGHVGLHGGGAWHVTRWGEFARMAASCARALRARGIAAGDRVAIVSQNRPEFLIAETALLAIRAVPVPTYTTNTAEDHAHILRDSGARAAIAANGRIADLLLRAGPLDLLVRFDVEEDGQEGATRVLAWRGLIADAAPPDDIAAEAEGIAPGALSALIYTSGTGGAPRGVMLPHRSILANCRGAFELLRPLRLQDETYLSFLPMSHAYEHMVGKFFLPSIGTEIVYGRGIEHLAQDLLTVQPTIMTVVPRILEVIRARVLAQVAREKPFRRALFARALAIGEARADGARVALADRLLDPLLDRVVRGKIRARFGGRFKAAMSGGARLDPEVGRFFLALGLKIMQGYGQTEAGPVISANPPDAIRAETVGTPLHGVEVRIAEDGEILARGDVVMDGYWNNPQATQAALEGGWLRTGDIGVLDGRNYLRITDRKKDFIVLSGGDKVAPARVETLLMAEPGILQAVVCGEGRSALGALIVLAEGHEAHAATAAIERVNKQLGAIERIRRHAIVPPFTIENGLLTPTHKIRRALVLRAHEDEVARLHG